MSSVTARIEEIQKDPILKQPRGGYIQTSWFNKKTLNVPSPLCSDLYQKENISPSLVGSVVDYMTRFMLDKNQNHMERVFNAFKISIIGFQRLALLTKATKSQIENTMLPIITKIKGVDDLSIFNACRLASYDVWVRNPSWAIMNFNPDADIIPDIVPDINTVKNIQKMVQRSICFMQQYGPILKDGFTFEDNGYTKTVNSGDGDFLTYDTLWDFKTIKGNLTAKHSLQLMMYWIMGQHSGQDIYKNISKIGIFNPRLNIVYTLDVAVVPDDTINFIEKKIICY